MGRLPCYNIVKMKAVTEYTLYAKRYLIGYLLVLALFIGILSIAAFYVPGALRQGEMQSALTSGALSMQSINPESVVNLPYYILQRLSFLTLGVTPFSIKLPSIILGALTAIGIFVLTRTWFRRNVAVITTAIAISSTQFLFLLQDGTPAILFSFITVWLLAACTFVTRSQLFTTFWKVVACVLMATALYIPLGIYVVLAIVITASLHPHIRYVIRRVARVRFTIALLLGLISVAPLIYAIIIKPSVALMLLGIPTEGLNLPASLLTAGQDLFGFFSTSNSHQLRPLYPLATTLLILIGIYKLLTVKYTARSYTVLILGACLTLLVAINPTHATALYPIAVLMIAMGIATLIVNWYKLFPRNPYARVAGLVPITVLVVGLVFSGLMRYMNNYTYNPNILSHYTTDLRLLDNTLAREAETKKLQLVTAPSELPFYGLVAHYDSRFSANTTADPAATTIIFTKRAHKAEPVPALPLSTIVTSQKSSDADRFYVYKNTAK